MNSQKINNYSKSRIRLSKSIIGQEEKSAVINALDEGYLGMGKSVKTFEQNLSLMMNRPTVCVVNGTAALHLSLQACGIGKGDEVLVQSITYLASFQAISATGATPVACDIDKNTLSIDVKDAKKRITPKTKAIMPVHYAGCPGDYEAIYKLAKENNLRVIEDAAHAFGSKINDEYIGSFGDIVCFSFDGIKNITSGEGGCITSKDKKFISKIKDLRLLGVEKDTDARFKGLRSWEFDVKEQGWRYHMSNIMASIGIAQLKKLDIFSAKRQNIAKYYDKKLAKVKNIYFFIRDYSSIMPHIYPVRLSSSIDRKNFQKFLDKKGIETGIHYQPNHKLDLYKDKFSEPLKNTEEIYKNILSLPLHPELEEINIDYIVDSIEEYMNNLP